MRDPKKYKKLISKIAWQYLPSFKGSKEMKDLIQDGYEVFINVCRQEQGKPLTCPFHTALGIQLKQKLLNELEALNTQKRGKDISFTSYEYMLQSSERPMEYDEQNEVDQALTINPVERMDKFIDLSEEMKFVACLLMDTPSELITLSQSFGIQNAINKYLKVFKGWKPRQIRKLNKELALAVK